MSIRIVQEKLRAAGFDPGPLDGQWGSKTAAALDAALMRASPTSGVPLAWGRKVSREFALAAMTVASRLGVPADDFMACIAWETGRTFSPSVRNAAGSGATGLIQFMPATARELGTTVEALAKLSAVHQLAWVERYFQPWKGRLKNLGDLYMAILWPAGIGKPDSYVLWEKGKRPETYRQNSGIDINRDGAITRGEALRKVQGMLDEGRLPENLGFV